MSLVKTPSANARLPAHPSCGHIRQKSAPKSLQSKSITVVLSSSSLKAPLKFSKPVGGNKQKTNNGSNYPHCLTLAFLPAFCMSTRHPQQQRSVWISVPFRKAARDGLQVHHQKRKAPRSSTAPRPEQWTRTPANPSPPLPLLLLLTSSSPSPCRGFSLPGSDLLLSSLRLYTQTCF